MSLYKKTLIIISITLIVLITIIFISSHIILSKSFKELENQFVQKNTDRVISVINDEMMNLNRTIHDWAAWDDSYEFIQGKYKKYIHVNLTDSTFINLNLNVIMFLDKNWDIYYSKAFDLKNQRQSSLPESLLRHIERLKNMKPFDINHKSIYGIIRLDEGPALIVLHPIVNSKETKPQEGTLLFLRFLNDEWVKDLSRKMLMDVSLKIIDTPASISKQPRDLEKFETSKIYIRTIDDSHIEGSKIIKDIYGNDAILFSITMERDIYKHFNTTVRYMIIIFLILGTFTIILTLFLLKRLILTRLKKLTDGVIEIRETGNSSLRLDIKGKDEISMLAQEINKMLQAQEETERILHTSSLTDDLTGLYNRRGFVTLAEQQFKIADRSHNEMLLIFADVDNLKDINDRFGHLQGDRALIDISQIIKETFRESDIIARIGGDEFVILTTETDSMNSDRIVSRLMENIKRFNDRHPRKYFLSISIGTAKYNPDNPCTIEELIAQADRMMYENKHEK